MQYTDFHIHTKYTVGNGITSIPDLVRRAGEYGMEALTITDSGSIAGFKGFEKECYIQGIRPHFACGFYFAPLGLDDSTTHHLVLLAKNYAGLENIKLLDNYSRAKGMGSKNRIDWHILEDHREGLVALSGGLGGVYDKPWLQGDRELAEKNIKRLSNLFKGDLYLELQDNETENNRIMNRELDRLGEELGIETIITGGSFYLKREDADRCNSVRSEHGNRPLTGNGYFFKSGLELKELSLAYPRAFKNACLLSGELSEVRITK